MKRVRLSRGASADLAGVLSHSAAKFGVAARRRYAALFEAAFADLAEAAERQGSRAAPEHGEGIRLFHLRNSRRRDPSEFVRQPRHIIVYRVAGNVIEVIRVLHDAMDIGNQLAAGRDPSETGSS